MLEDHPKESKIFANNEQVEQVTKNFDASISFPFKSKRKINQTRKTKTHFAALKINIVGKHFISRHISTDTLKNWVKSILYLLFILNPDSRKTAFTLMSASNQILFVIADKEALKINADFQNHANESLIEVYELLDPIVGRIMRNNLNQE